MEYNLTHAMLGRFGVLIPLLGLFFELASVITQKKLVSTISGAIVIFASIIVLLAGLTGVQELSYLASSNQSVASYKLHTFAGYFLIFSFTIILFMRIYLYKNVREFLVVVYFFVYTVAVMVNLLSNEFIIHTLRGG